LSVSIAVVKPSRKMPPSLIGAAPPDVPPDDAAGEPPPELEPPKF